MRSIIFDLSVRDGGCDGYFGSFDQGFGTLSPTMTLLAEFSTLIYHSPPLR